MSTGPCEAAPIARDCQFSKVVVVRPIVPKVLMYRALSSARNSYEGTTPRKRTEPDQSYPKASSIRPNGVFFIFAVLKGLMGNGMLALRLRTSAT